MEADSITSGLNASSDMVALADGRCLRPPLDPNHSHMGRVDVPRERATVVTQLARHGDAPSASPM